MALVQTRDAFDRVPINALIVVVMESASPVMGG